MASPKFVLPNNTQPATDTRPGVVKIGTGLYGAGDGTVSLATINGLTAGTYKSVTVDTYGRVTGGTNPTSISGYGITDAVTNTHAVIKTNNKLDGTAVDTDYALRIESGDTTPLKVFSIAQSGLTTIKTNVNKAGGLNTDEAFRIESFDSQALFQVMTNGDTVIGGILKVNGTGTSEFAGDVTIGGKLQVDGTITGGTSASLGTDFTVEGKLVVKGDTELGDNAGTDTTTIRGLTTIYGSQSKASIDALITAYKTANPEITPTQIQGYKDGLANTNLTANVPTMVSAYTAAHPGIPADQITGYSDGVTKSKESDSIARYNDTFVIYDSVNQPLFQVKGNGDTVIAGVINVNGDGQSTFSGDVSIGGALTVHDGITSGTSLDLGEDLTVQGKLVVKGDTDLGDDASVDKTTIRGLATVYGSESKDAINTLITAYKTAHPGIPAMQVQGFKDGLSNTDLNAVVDTLATSYQNNTTPTPTAEQVIGYRDGVTKSKESSTIARYLDTFAIRDSASKPLFQVKGNGDTVIAGVISVNGDGESTFAGNLNVAGNVDIGGQLKVTGGSVQADMHGTDLTLTGNLIVKGNSTLGDSTDGAADTTVINGITTINSGKAHDISGGKDIEVFGINASDAVKLFQVMANGDTFVGNNLKVVGGSVVNANMEGQDLTVNGNLIVKGNMTFGDIDTPSDVIETITVNGKMTMAQDLNMNGKKITNVAIPTDPTDAANKAYVDNVVTGLDVKQSVKAATIPWNGSGNGSGALAGVYDNGTLTITANVNGVFPNIDGSPDPVWTAGDRILVKNQQDVTAVNSAPANAIQNGLYIITDVGSSTTKWKLTRAADADNSPNGEVSSGLFTFVEQGTTNKDSGWVLTSPDLPIVLGTSQLIFTQFAGVGSVSSGSGINQNGTTFSLAPATTTSLGGVIVPTSGHLSVDGAGNISVPTTDASTYGVMKAGTDLTSTSGDVSVVSSQIRAINKIVKSKADAGIEVGPITSDSVAAVTTSGGTGAISAATTITAGTGLTVSAGGAAITGNSSVVGTFTANATSVSTLTTTGKIISINGSTTGGNYGVSAVVADQVNKALTTTTATDVVTFTTPATAGNYLVYIYFKISSAAALQLDLIYDDGTAQTQNIVASSAGNQTAGSYSITPIYINSAASKTIKVTATASAANSITVSATIIAI